jgi:hypothetical protein
VCRPGEEQTSVDGQEGSEVISKSDHTCGVSALKDATGVYSEFHCALSRADAHPTRSGRVAAGDDVTQARWNALQQLCM